MSIHLNVNEEIKQKTQTKKTSENSAKVFGFRLSKNEYKFICNTVTLRSEEQGKLK